MVFWEDERASLQARIAELEAAQPVAVTEGVDPLDVLALLSPVAERLRQHYGGWATGKWGNRKLDTPEDLVLAFIDALPDHQCKCDGECEGESDDAPSQDDWQDAVALILRQGEPGHDIDRRQFLREHAPMEAWA